jgi:hypothetical protein
MVMNNTVMNEALREAAALRVTSGVPATGDMNHLLRARRRPAGRRV